MNWHDELKRALASALRARRRARTTPGEPALAGEPRPRPPRGAGTAAAPHGHTIPDGALADLATSLWRLRGRLAAPGPEQPADDTRRAFRHVEAAVDALAEAGIEIQGHDGDPFDPGQAITAVAFQPAADVDRERVIETIRPTVYCGGELIQRGEVIVATPALPAAGIAPAGPEA